MIDFNPEFCRNESEVESKLIVSYLLPELGYQPHTWHQEVAFGNIRLDFLAFAVRVLPFTFNGGPPPSLVIEAKGPSTNLKNHVYQLKNYLRTLHIDYGVLTNGREFKIYERTGKNIQVLLQCPGHEVIKRIEEIKHLIGRDHLREKRARANDNLATESTKRKRNMKIITIYHNKGGVGKTTVSVNLAAALRNQGYTVLLIDLDSQANSTFATGLVKFQFEEDDNLKENNVFHLLESLERNPVSDVIRSSDFFNTPELDVVPAHIGLIEGQYKLNKIMTIKTRLISKLRPEENSYDFVIIDTPPSRDLYAQIAMITAHYLIIPSDLKPFANQGLSSVKGFIKEINEFKESIARPPLKLLGVLPSKVSGNSYARKFTFPKQKATIVEKYQMPVMDTVISDKTALSHCLNQTVFVGELEVPNPKSIFDYAKGNASAGVSAAEFEALATEVLKKIEVNHV